MVTKRKKRLAVFGAVVLVIFITSHIVGLHYFSEGIIKWNMPLYRTMSESEKYEYALDCMRKARLYDPLISIKSPQYHEIVNGYMEGLKEARQNCMPTKKPNENERVVVGQVLEVHMLGEKEENVTICHFDPRYVVSVQTESGIEKLAIHSPTNAFMGANPVGKNYRFHLSKHGQHFLLSPPTAEKIGP